MKLDRELQNRILTKLSESYPGVSPDVMFTGKSTEDLNANLAYLLEHGLIHATASRGMEGPPKIIGPKITAKGLDFLADDGGLSAILGVVTVRFQADTLKALIESKIMASDETPEEKSRLLAGLKSLSGDAIKHLTMNIVDKGLANLPDAFQTIGTWIHSLA